jgi:5'-methylthioadenosine phosphorylase
MRVGRHGAHEIVTMLRHGPGHQVAAHQVNYRANIWAFGDAKVDLLLGVSICGSLTPDVALGTLAIYDQIVDFTRTRPSTFFDRGTEVRNVDVSEPVCDGPRRRSVIALVRSAGLPCAESGVMVVIEGPRFSTRAENRMFRMLGGHFITMSAAPEAFLARELGLCYVPISLVTDHDVAGPDHVTADVIGRSVVQFRSRVPAAVAALLDKIDTLPQVCACCTGPPGAVPVDRLNLTGTQPG